MPDEFFGGLDFGTSGARISIINKEKDLIRQYTHKVEQIMNRVNDM